MYEGHELRDRLKRQTVQWALDGEVDASQAAATRRELAVINHRHYRQHVPYYTRVCERAGIGDTVDFERITRDLLIPDDLFKSYPNQLLEERDFNAMSAWVSRISDRSVNGSAARATSLESWLDALEEQDVHLVFSSGTSGHISFVPRHGETWDAFLRVAYLYIPLLLARRGVITGWRRAALRLLARAMAPEKFLDRVQQFGLRDTDGFFLNFAGGNQGIQLVGQETARLTRRAVFLYDRKLTATAVRTIVRGPRTEEEKSLLDEFLSTTVWNKDASYDRFVRELEASVRAKRRVVLFGAPYVLKELCERLPRPLVLPRGSHVTFGGGWKSFDGSRIPDHELYKLISATLGVEPHAIVEGYSMTEIHALMIRCDAGRYHVPPYLEVVILDDALEPVEGTRRVGALGVIDPFAHSYPGFLVTGDHVEAIDGTCTCGLSGTSILQVERSPGREVKGCGGIMASVNA